MTDNDIIKALECCASGTQGDVCECCPFDELKICEGESNGLEKRAFDLVNRQKAEIERLSIELKAMRAAANSYKMHYEKARTEVAREIFEEIIIAVFSKLPSDVLPVRRDCDFTDGVRSGKREAIFDMIKTLVELKKKYTDDEETAEAETATQKASEEA